MKLLLYCTKGKPLFRSSGDYDDWCFNNFFDEYVCARDYYNYHNDYETVDEEDLLNGKIVAECDYEVEKFDFISFLKYEDDVEKYNAEVRKINEICKKSCLGTTAMVFYLDTKALGTKNPNGMIGYAIHIKNLHIFNKPKELSDFYKYNYKDETWSPVNKAPQNMCYVWDEHNIKYALISIHPEWLCKILNGEKTIEVRKVVLKEMEK
jgi:hypothetical protein